MPPVPCLVRGSLFALVLASGCARAPSAQAPAREDKLPLVGAKALRPPESFASIQDRAARSRALFLEMSRVLQHPRCANCHPDGDVPHQGMEMTLHDPPVVRGPGNRGVVGMECSSCHQDHNLELARVPGAPDWHLAPREMAWVGKSPGALCQQLKDPRRNGGKSLDALVEHNGQDKLVGWGWNPGHGREPAPGTQKEFGALTRAWVDSGAECPNEEARP